MRRLRLALAQMNPTVGDLEGNADRMLALMEQAVAEGAGLIAFPEPAVTGYPPEALPFTPRFLHAPRFAPRRSPGRNPQPDAPAAPGLWCPGRR